MRSSASPDHWPHSHVTRFAAVGEASHIHKARPRDADAGSDQEKEDVHERLYTLALLQAAKAEQRRKEK